MLDRFKEETGTEAEMACCVWMKGVGDGGRHPSKRMKVSEMASREFI